MTPIIDVKQLSKKFKVARKEPGLFGSVKSLLHREYRLTTAVNNISVTIGEGELVGFIGPNGAGKTTTLKMLSGLLHPTSGRATVLGHTPWQRPPAFLKQIALVMGQKAQLWWDLPLADSLLLQKDIYEVPDDTFQENLAELTDLLELKPFLNIQVRRLSLGQRMRGELAAALIYRPRVLFLDEPTIGLDVVVQKKVRAFISDYRRRHRATIILTSHYLGDVKELAQRVIVIDHGTIVFDGQTQALINRHATDKRIILTLAQPVPDAALARFGTIVANEPARAVISVPREHTSRRAAQLLAAVTADDIAIEEPTLEEVVQQLFTTGTYV